MPIVIPDRPHIVQGLDRLLRAAARQHPVPHPSMALPADRGGIGSHPGGADGCGRGRGGWAPGRAARPAPGGPVCQRARADTLRGAVGRGHSRSGDMGERSAASARRLAWRRSCSSAGVRRPRLAGRSLPSFPANSSTGRGVRLLGKIGMVRREDGVRRAPSAPSYCRST